MIKQVDASRVQARLQKMKGMQKGIQRVHKKLIHEHKQLAKELDEYHKEIVKQIVKGK